MQTIGVFCALRSSFFFHYIRKMKCSFFSHFVHVNKQPAQIVFFFSKNSFEFIISISCFSMNRQPRAHVTIRIDTQQYLPFHLNSFMQFYSSILKKSSFQMLSLLRRNFNEIRKREKRMYFFLCVEKHISTEERVVYFSSSFE